MRAMVYEKYGSPEVLGLKEMQKPQPGAGQVLVRVGAAAVNAADSHLLKGTPVFLRLVYGLTKPKNPVLGSDVAGTVEAVGPGATRFKVGDAVFGDLSGSGLGGFAEYVCAPETVLTHKPANLSLAEAAAVPMASLTALQAIRKAELQAGQKVLVYGASGGVGTFAVQIAKAMGAKVTAVCSTSKVELLKSLGADPVIDYTQQDVTQSLERYDVILVVNGKRSVAEYKRVLAHSGRLVVVGGDTGAIFQSMLLGKLFALGTQQKISNLLARPNAADLDFVKGLIEAGKVRPVMDKLYALSDLPQAMRYMTEGRAKGKVVIQL